MLLYSVWVWKFNVNLVLTVKLPCAAVLLQDLKRGQKCYLYSIMRVYDRKPLREMLSHQYMLNLQRQNLLGKCRLVLLCPSAIYRNWSLEGKPGVSDSHSLHPAIPSLIPHSYQRPTKIRWIFVACPEGQQILALIDNEFELKTFHGNCPTSHTLS
uniref:Uncharacterized protein n=1 Tax=Terrapene triunguis TaxID=2587831 RepID=A0A674JA81_9SAUR